MKRYQKTQIKNVRKDLKTGKFEAYKTIKGTRYSEHFKKISDAKAWVKQFHPSLAKEDNSSGCFAEKYELYRKRVNPKLALSTQDRKDQNISYFMSYFKDMPIETITPKVISDTLEDLKLKASKKRFNFKNQLKELRACFNWLIDHEEINLTLNPVRKHHNDDAFVKEIPIKKKHLGEDEFNKFMSAFENELFKDFAYVQLILGCRVSEVLALHKSDIDLKNNVIKLQHSAMWSSNKKFLGIKKRLKNGKIDFIPIGAKKLRDILEKYLKISDSEFLFSIDNKMITYRQAQHAFDIVFKRTGIKIDCSTHSMRNTMGKKVNEEMGSIDAVQAVLGHDDIRMSQHYAGKNRKLQLEAQIKVANSLDENVQECAKEEILV